MIIVHNILLAVSHPWAGTIKCRIVKLEQQIALSSLYWNSIYTTEDTRVKKFPMCKAHVNVVVDNPGSQVSL